MTETRAPRFTWPTWVTSRFSAVFFSECNDEHHP